MIVTDNDRHTIVLSGGGKRGVQAQARPLDGKHVHATGFGVKRGDRDLLLVGDLDVAPGEAVLPTREALGTWRLTGEVCDGKCSLGVMRPGNKPAHKACANVCLLGGVPPVFITTTLVFGTRYVLMGDLENHALLCHWLASRWCRNFPSSSSCDGFRKGSTHPARGAAQTDVDRGNLSFFRDPGAAIPPLSEWPMRW